MSFLGPISGTIWMYFAIGAAALAVGAYIIKMRRRRFEVPFAELWKRVLDTKDANALWKQLKRLISLLLVLLILGLVLFAALDPTLGAVDRQARSVVILIDASASMKTLDGAEGDGTSRIDAAKRKADELIDSMGGGDVAMIIKVDGQATPLSRFTNDKAMLHKYINGVARSADATTPGTMQLDGISASDTPADLPRALGAAADALRDRKNPLVVLISDGAFPEAQLGLVDWDKPKGTAPATSGSASAPPTAGTSLKNLATVDLSGIDVRYVPVGRRSDNVGLVAFNVRRYIANKAAYEVFIEVQNFGVEPTKRKLTLLNGGTPVDTKTIELAPGQRLRLVYEKLPASEENQLRATLGPLREGDVVVPGTSDAFALDDVAYALLPARKKQKVLMVTEDNLFLEGALLVYDNVEPLKVTPAEYTANPAMADGMDVVIFDDFTPPAMPPPPASLLYFHPTGPGSPFVVRSELSSPRITEIAEDHPVMRWVTMSDVYTDKSNSFAIDAKKGESTIAYSVRDSIVAAKRDGRRKILAFGFSLPAAGRASATDLPMRVAFPMLLVNTLDWFAGDQADLLTTYPTGRRERIPLDGVVGATEAVVTAPDTVETKTPIIDGLATFYGNKVGFYEVTAKGPDGKIMATIKLAANLASVAESDIAPSGLKELNLGGKTLTAPESFEITRSQKLWWYFVLIALALIVAEWVTYHRRITV